MTILQSSEAVEQEIRIAARPQIIWGFLTESAKLIHWMGKTATLDPRPGGIYHVYMNENNVAHGEFLELEPYRRLVFSWGWESPGEVVRPGTSTVEITLTEENAGTMVRLRHCDLPVAEQASHAEGWAYFLPRLIRVVEGREPEEAGSSPTE